MDAICGIYCTRYWDYFNVGHTKLGQWKIGFVEQLTRCQAKRRATLAWEEFQYNSKFGIDPRIIHCIASVNTAGYPFKQFKF